MEQTNTVFAEVDASGRVKQAKGPGLFDIQVNGCAGVDFNTDPAKLNLPDVLKAFRAMRRRGVAICLPTFTTDAVTNVFARLRAFEEFRGQDALLAEMIPGYHVEGILISPQDGPRGAHPVEHCKTALELPNLLDDLQQAAGGRVKLFSVAPEVPGVLDVIAKGSRAGVLMALAHHMATPDIIAQAVSAGAKLCTHLGNGAHAMLPRHDNYIQHQLADDRLWASFIADGHHIVFPALKNFLRAKEFGRCVLTTDAVAPADAPPGQYSLGRTKVDVGSDGRVSLAGTPYLAGSSLTLDMAILNAHYRCDVPLAAAWLMASAQPAKLFGLPVPPQIHVNVTDQGFVMYDIPADRRRR